MEPDVIFWHSPRMTLRHADDDELCLLASSLAVAAYGRCSVAKTAFFFTLVLLIGFGLENHLRAALPDAHLTWKTNVGFRVAELALTNAGRTGFTLLHSETTGIRFTNFVAEERHLTNQILLNGSGVAAGDVDGDGWCDLYFCGLDGPNALYRNLGNWRFEDITASAGVACPDLDATGAALADIDGDGDLDLIVNSIAGGTYV